MDEQKVLAHVQAVARQFNSWRGKLPALIGFVQYSMGTDAPDAARLDVYLRKEATQRELVSWEVGLWCAVDKSYRLVSLTVPTDPEVAKRRLAHRPTSTDHCSWCHQCERSFAPIELKPELDIYRNPVPARFLHPACMHSWLLMRALVERETA